MTTKLYYNPFVPAFSNIGVAIPGAFLYFYYAGTSVLAPIFTDAAATIPLANPQEANQAGKYVDIYLDETVTYRIIQTDATGASIGDAVDPYIPGTALAGVKGDTGGNVMAIGPRADIGNITVPVGTAMVWTSGGVSDADGGHVAMLLDADQTAISGQGALVKVGAIGRGQSDATATAAIAEMESRYRVKDIGNRWFITEARHGIDHRAYALAGDTPLKTVQAALDLAQLWSRPPARFAAGISTFGSSVWAARGDTFRSAKVEGSGQGYFGSLFGHSTVWKFTDANKPGVIFQGYRAAHIRDLSIIGPGLDAFAAASLGTTTSTVDDYDITVWRSVAGFTDGRYAPPAGVVLDPLVGTIPVGGTGVNRPYSFSSAEYKPDWLGPLALYGRPSSSEFKAENVEIMGWDVGLVINPSGSNYQTDYTTIDRCRIAYCVIGISIGDTNSRGVRIPDCNVALCHTLITNRSHGERAGRIGGQIEIRDGACIKVLDLDLSLSGSVSLPSMYVEQAFMMGTVDCGTFAGGGALDVSSGEVNYTDATTTRGSPPYILGPSTSIGQGINYAKVKFGPVVHLVREICSLLANELELNGTGIKITEALNGQWEVGGIAAISDATQRKARKMAYNGTAGLSTPRFVPKDYNFLFAPIDIDGTSTAFLGIAVNDRAFYPFTSRATCIPHWQRAAQPWSYTEAGFQAVDMPRRSIGTQKSAFTGFTRTGRTWTGSFNPSYWGASGYEPRARWNNISAGRVCIDSVSGTSFWVKRCNFTTGIIILEQLHNWYRPVGATEDQPREPISMTDGGNLHFIETGFYMPACSLVGDVTAGSPIVTNLRRPEDGDFAWLTDTTYAAGNPVANDWLYYDDRAPGAFPFTGAAAKISAFNGAARTMTMSGNSGVTATGVSFPLFRRTI